MTDLDRLAWPDLPATAVLAVPLGATEQHGPHLPLGTDTLVATALVDALAARRPGVLAAPALPYGASGEHGAFPGTLSLGQEAFELAVVELVRSADRFDGVVLVNGHGGNAEPLGHAVATLRAEGRDVLAWAPRVAGGDAHAGRTETSLLLALHPELVGTPVAGNTTPLGELLPAMRAGGVAAVSPTGVLGDGRDATAAAGRRLLADLLDDLLHHVDRWRAGR